MKIKEEYLKEDFIGKIYYNEIYFSEILPSEKEYREISNNIISISESLLLNLDKSGKEKFKTYMELVNEKESLEAKNEFELGFKTAVKLIVEGLK